VFTERSRSEQSVLKVFKYNKVFVIIEYITTKLKHIYFIS